MKKLISLITLCLMCIFFALPQAAMASPSLLVDDADVLTDEEEAVLSEHLNEASAKYKTDIIAVTVSDAGISADDPDYDSKLEKYSDYYILNNGYGQGSEQDAILFLIDLRGRGYHFSTHGQTIYAFTDAGIEELKGQVTPFLRNGDYAGAISEFCSDAEGMIDYKNVNGYALYEDQKNSPGKTGVKAVVSVIIGFIISMIATGQMKGKLKTVRSKTSASDYFNPANLRLTGQKDTFLYHNVTRVPINTENKNSGGGGFSTHSTGGSSFGGGGGRF